MASIAVVGGTGQLGKAIARRLAKAGHDVAIGSRRAASAAETAAELGGLASGGNVDVAKGRDVVFVTVPFAAQADTLTQIKGVVGDAIVVDTTVSLVPPKVIRVQLPPAGSAALAARGHLGEQVGWSLPFTTSLHISSTPTRMSTETCWCSPTTPQRAAW